MGKKFNASTERENIQLVEVPKAPAPAVRGAEEDIGQAHPYQAMAIYKHAEPIVTAMINRPGSASPLVEKAKAVASLLSSAKSGAEVLLQTGEFGRTQVRYVKSEMFGLCARAAAEQWKQGGSELDCLESITQVARLTRDSMGLVDDETKHWMECSGSAQPAETEEEGFSAIRLSTLKGAFRLASEINEFCFWMKGEEAKTQMLDAMMGKLMTVAARTANTLADAKGIPPESRIQLWQGTISRVFGFASEEYRSIRRMAETQMEQQSGDERKAACRGHWASYGPDYLAGEVSKRSERSLDILHHVVERHINLDLFAAKNNFEDLREEEVEKPTKSTQRSAA